MARAKEGDFDALRTLSRIRAYKRDIPLGELKWKELVKLAIRASESAEDVFHLIWLARSLFKEGEEEFKKQTGALLVELIQNDKLHRVSSSTVSLIGLQFACRWAAGLEVDIDVASLIKEYYETLYTELAGKGEEDRKALKQLTLLLPQVQEALTQDPAETYKKVSEGSLQIGEVRVVSQIICKFEGCLKSAVNALIRKDNAFYFSGEFTKPGSKCVTFNIHDLTKQLTLGFTSNFASIFYRLGGRTKH